MRSSLMVSAQVVLYINGKPYANVSGFRWDSQTPGKSIRGIDSSEAYELAPTTFNISGQLTLYRQVNSGGLEGAGIIPQIQNLPRNKYFTLALVDILTDTTIFRANRCWPHGQSWDVPVRGRISGSLSFEAIDWNNEASNQ